ncbi:hypothetical protein DOK78_001114 [Enterococcus sp. DIV2402]|uniref:Uncharacterized protein n=1 Tax=Candidatus Enterococcus lowellii TaxID=2230877 RepID=A0ABZ2SLV8_9ENTE|nr:hypothetical protein [Enterococcus sp. DIV2402]MBO0464683.1 hypothetical protein [Enterococcus sp. DIV2402]
MSRRRLAKEQNGDIYCSVFIKNSQALTQLQSELKRQHFQHAQTLVVDPLNAQLISQLGTRVVLEFLLVIIHGQKLFQYTIHSTAHSFPHDSLFTEQHKIYIHPDYIEIYRAPDNLPPYSSFQVLA